MTFIFQKKYVGLFVFGYLCYIAFNTMPGIVTGHKTVQSGIVSFSHIGFIWHMQVWSSPSHLGLGLWALVAKAAGTVFGALCSPHLLFIPFPFLSFFPLLTLSPLLHPSISSSPLFSFSPSPLLFLFLAFLQNRALLRWENQLTPQGRF